MSLKPGNLVKGFNSFASGRLISFFQAERKWAEIYHDYAKTVTDISLDGATNLDVDLFQAPLDFVRSRTPAQFANQLADAFVMYWENVEFEIALLPPVSGVCPNSGGTGVFSIETTSKVTKVEKDILLRKILPILNTVSVSAPSKITQLSLALHQATIEAIEVTIAGLDDDTIPSPITNICGVQ